MDGSGGGDGGGGFDGADVGMAAGMGAGAGLFMNAGAMGSVSRMVPPTPGAPLTAAQVRAQLEAYQQLQAEGIITQEEYEAVKARILGLAGP